MLFAHGAVFAWNAEGHRIQTQRAVQALSVQHQGFYRELATVLGFGDNIGMLGVFADRVKNETLEQVFRRYGQAVPASLQALRSSDTRRWHYTNHFIYVERSRRCRLSNNGTLGERLRQLDQLLLSERAQLTIAQRAILLSLQLHLIQDAHQPLHLMARVERGDCKSDLGGNRFCVERGLAGACGKSLHQLWDSGFSQYHASFAPENDVPVKFDVELWLQEGYSYAGTIYGVGLREYEGLSEAYTFKAQAVARRQLQNLHHRTVNYLEVFATRYLSAVCSNIKASQCKSKKR